MYQISNLLELSHNDLGDYNNTMSKGGKKYKITFDNGRSKFTEVYMLNSTYDAIHKFWFTKLKYKSIGSKIQRVKVSWKGSMTLPLLKNIIRIIHGLIAPNGLQQRIQLKGRIEFLKT